tara:strand:- start:75 stop:677 length:603 start_codon:yes stop_codon:yes gene_type:complete
MWHCDRLLTTLTELSKHELISEIILIDNTNKKEKLEIPKVNHVLEGLNTYVNPSWNKGAELATENILLVLNDDVWFDWDIYLNIAKQLTINMGIVGLHTSTYDYSGIQKPKLNYIGDKGMYGFACAFFILKENWIKIDDKLKIYGGDNQLIKQLYINKKNNYAISNITTYGYISLSVNKSKTIKDVIDSDWVAMKELGLC